MTLRRTLLLAFILLGLLPSAALSWLSFIRTREAMTAQIEQSLAVQAGGLQSDIDAMLFERFENALVWSRSELMQDLSLGDVDKRVTNYLVGLQAGYGDMYRAIDCRSDGGAVIASSDAAHLGRDAPPLEPAARSFEAQLSGGAASLYLPGPPVGGRRGPMVIETLVPQTYALPGALAMRMRLDFNVGQIDRLLDAAAGGRRDIVVVDARGRWVAASARLRARSWPGADANAASLAVADAGGAELDAAPGWPDGPALVGRSHSRATASFAGSGWTTLVLEPVDEALMPVVAMSKIFVGLLVAVLLATLLVASVIASAISRPIDTLTAMTRRFRQEGRGAGEPAVRSRIVELDVLGRAYAEMIQAVEDSRQELVRSSKMAMLGELAAVLGHEVRTPLGILRSSAQVLKRDPGLGEEGRELMGFIESETQRLNRLVSTMLDTARPRLPAYTRCDVHVLLQRCAQMHDLQHERINGPHAVTLALAATHPQIDADEEQLMQAFFNLLNNATQAAGPQGRVALATADDGASLRVTCADDGPGIPPDIAERIFDPFVSGRTGGIGLGLAVVRQVAAAHGGTVVVGRSEWGGAAFALRLPRRRVSS